MVVVDVGADSVLDIFGAIIMIVGAENGSGIVFGEIVGKSMVGVGRGFW